MPIWEYFFQIRLSVHIWHLYYCLGINDVTHSELKIEKIVQQTSSKSFIPILKFYIPNKLSRFHHIFSPLCLTMYYYSLWKLSCWQSRQKIRCRSLDKWLVQLRVNIANYWDTKAVWLPTDQFRIRPQIHRYSPIPCSLKVIKINDTPSNVLIGYRSADRQYLE